MKKNNKIFLLILFFLIILPSFVFAQSPLEKLKIIGSDNGPYQHFDNPTASISSTIGLIIKTFLSLLGVIFIILMLLSGYNWMTAYGDEQKVEKAKDTIQRAIIGLLIIVSSYAIWILIFNKIIKGNNP